MQPEHLLPLFNDPFPGCGGAELSRTKTHGITVTAHVSAIKSFDPGHAGPPRLGAAGAGGGRDVTREGRLVWVDLLFTSYQVHQDFRASQKVLP